MTDPSTQDNSATLALRKSIKAKLAEVDDFGTLCATAFYSALFARLPGTKDLFGRPQHAVSMFSVMLSLLISKLDNSDELDVKLHDLGDKHRRRGILPVHLQVGREIFLQAVGKAAPKLNNVELAYFGRLYDRITKPML